MAPNYKFYGTGEDVQVIPVYIVGTTGNEATISSGGANSSNVTVAPISSATLTNVSASASSVQLLASNSARQMALFQNESNAGLYLKFGTTASATSYTVFIPKNSYYELPLPLYTGRIDGIWESATGTVRITEM